VIGYDNPNDTYAEEISITGASGTSGAGNLTGATRGVNADGSIGAARAWDSATNIAVMFSTGIYEQIRANDIAINANTRELLTANRTYYVATTGNDTTGDGSSGNPWATIQHAYNIIVATLDTAGYTVTIQVADGIYTAGLSINKSWSGGGSIYILGNITNPENINITTVTSAFNITCLLPAIIYIYGFTLSSTTFGINHGGIGQIRINNIRFNAMSYGLYCAVKTAIIYCEDSQYEIFGNMNEFALSVNGTISIHRMDIILTDTPNFSVAFVRAQRLSEIYAVGLSIISGSATGKYYSIESNSVLSLGSTTLPGDTAGTTATGGQVL
jgi:hypothetical protein